MRPGSLALLFTRRRATAGSIIPAQAGIHPDCDLPASGLRQRDAERRAGLLGLALIAFGATTPLWASHPWGGLDLCGTFPERMPPPLDPRVLPEPQGRAASLLTHYCAQCHNAPAPGQHTPEEWGAVVERMRLVMEATARFSAQIRPVHLPDGEDLATLLAYLQTHALRPLARPEEAPPAYRTLCGDCHAAPDPSAYREVDWPTLLARMTDHRRAMARPPVDAADEAQARAYLGIDPAPGPGPTAPHQTVADRYGRWLALAPFFALAFLGLGRWWLHRTGRA